MLAEQHAEIVDLMYAAATEAELWTVAMDRFADAVGGGSSWLSQLNLVEGGGAGMVSRMDPAAQDLYFSRFKLRDPLSNVENPRQVLADWTPCVFTDEDLIPKEALRRTEFYNDFMKRIDVHSVLMLRLGRRGDSIATMNINRSEQQGQFEGQAMDIARRLHPHLIRAFNLSQKLADVQQLFAPMADALDDSVNGIFMLDDDGHILHANRMAETLLAEPAGLTAVGGRLSAAPPDLAARLQALINAAKASEGGARIGGSMALRSPGRRFPLSISVAPIRLERRSFFYAQPSVIVTVSHLEARRSISAQGLRDLFQFTPAETRIAIALMDGCSPREVADRLGVSFQTVRNQLQRIFEKTGTNRQTELIRLIGRIADASG